MAPFEGMLNTNALQSGGSVLDVAAILALIGWTLLEALILAAVGVFRREPAPPNRPLHPPGELGRRPARGAAVSSCPATLTASPASREPTCGSVWSDRAALRRSRPP